VDVVDVNDILQMLFRWIHFLAGITWIGLLYYFNLINAHFQGALAADVRRQVVPEIMPRTLWWFRWGAMFTFLSGLLLIIWKYFFLGSGFGGESGLFSTDPGLWITLGSLFGTIMWFNVWFIIWPAQKNLITWTKEGQTPPEQPAVARRALYASRINTFLSVPLLFAMLEGAGHYPTISFNLVWLMIFKFASGVAKTWP
jgi:uncharacterized membrane protein